MQVQNWMPQSLVYVTMNVAGSHTLSTAGGNFVPGASVFGFGNGIASAGSPKARVAVLWMKTQSMMQQSLRQKQKKKKNTEGQKG